LGVFRHPLFFKILFINDSMHNHRTEKLVKKAIVESRIRKWFNRPTKKDLPPSKLLTKLIKTKKGLQLTLGREERAEFVDLIKRMNRTRKIILKYRKKYGRRPKIFYKKVFGFPTRDYQYLNVIWNTFHVHFIFDKNDLIAFWKRVQWGPGSGGYYSVGDRDIKVKELRGLISFGRRELDSMETRDIIRHESVHSFEDFVKRKSPPRDKKRFLFYRIKCELNASLKNFKKTKNRRKRRINEWARLGLGTEVRDDIDEYLSYSGTLKRIRNTKIKIRKSKSKREKKLLRKKLVNLKERLDKKKTKRRLYFSLYRRTTNQVKIALEIMPLYVLQRIIYETPFERLHKKIPEAVKVFKRIKYEWYNN
jgi:hypothetical protein